MGEWWARRKIIFNIQKTRKGKIDCTRCLKRFLHSVRDTCVCSLVQCSRQILMLILCCTFPPVLLLLTTFTFTFGWAKWMAPRLGRRHSILFTESELDFAVREMAETQPSATFRWRQWQSGRPWNYDQIMAKAIQHQNNRLCPFASLLRMHEGWTHLPSN